MVKSLATALLATALGFIACSCRAAEEPAVSPMEAAEFADVLLHVADAIGDRYFLEVSRGELIEWAVRGLYYRRAGASVPAEFEERLRAIGGMKDQEVRDLLCEVRRDVEHVSLLGGDRTVFGLEELSNDRYVDLALEEMTTHLEFPPKVLYGCRRLVVVKASVYRPSGKKLFKAHLPDADDDEWGVTPDPKYVLKLPPDERRDLAEHLDQQTYILPQNQHGKEDGPAFKDRQLEMALAYLHAHGD